MCDLIRSDFRRVLKDKLFMVVCIIALAFAVFMPLLYMLLFSGLDAMTSGMISGYVTAKGQFFAAFALADNMGLIVPILLTIILCKDFSFGTVRNKIISGHSRTQIFLSMYVVCAVVLWVIIFLHSLLTMCVSLLFFEYQADPFTWADFGYFMASVGFEFLVYLFAAALVSYLCVSAKNMGLTIVSYAAINLGAGLVGSILMISSQVLAFDESKEKTVKVLDFFQRINPFVASQYIGAGTSYELKDLIYHLLMPLALAALLILLGISKFNRKDLK